MSLTLAPDINYYQQLAYYAVMIACALIGIVGILLGLVLRNQHRSRQSVDATLHQVKNSHQTNMRDDLDEKFEGLAGLVKDVISTQSTQGRDIGGIRGDLRQIASRYDSELDDTRSRLRVLETKRAEPKTKRSDERPPVTRSTRLPRKKPTI